MGGIMNRDEDWPSGPPPTDEEWEKLIDLCLELGRTMRESKEKIAAEVLLRTKDEQR